MSMVEKAYSIILEAFAGKLDKAGEPYIFHLQRVAKPFEHDETLFVIGLLHDLFEDCPEWDFGRLIEAGFGPVICRAVSILTKRADHTYEQYLRRVAESHYARIVKISDLKDNMDISRIKRPLTQKDIERTVKYHKAYCYLSRF